MKLVLNKLLIFLKLHLKLRVQILVLLIVYSLFISIVSFSETSRIDIFEYGLEYQTDDVNLQIEIPTELTADTTNAAIYKTINLIADKISRSDLFEINKEYNKNEIVCPSMSSKSIFKSITCGNVVNSLLHFSNKSNFQNVKFITIFKDILDPVIYIDEIYYEEDYRAELYIDEQLLPNIKIFSVKNIDGSYIIPEYNTTIDHRKFDGLLILPLNTLKSNEYYIGFNFNSKLINLKNKDDKLIELFFIELEFELEKIWNGNSILLEYPMIETFKILNDNSSWLHFIYLMVSSFIIISFIGIIVYFQVLNYKSIKPELSLLYIHGFSESNLKKLHSFFYVILQNVISLFSLLCLKIIDNRNYLKINFFQIVLVSIVVSVSSLIVSIQQATHIIVEFQDKIELPEENINAIEALLYLLTFFTFVANLLLNFKSLNQYKTILSFFGIIIIIILLSLILKILNEQLILLVNSNLIKYKTYPSFFNYLSKIKLYYLKKQNKKFLSYFFVILVLSLQINFVNSLNLGVFNDDDNPAGDLWGTAYTDFSFNGNIDNEINLGFGIESKLKKISLELSGIVFINESIVNIHSQFSIINPHPKVFEMWIREDLDNSFIRRILNLEDIPATIETENFSKTINPILSNTFRSNILLPFEADFILFVSSDFFNSFNSWTYIFAKSLTEANLTHSKNIITDYIQNEVFWLKIPRLDSVLYSTNKMLSENQLLNYNKIKFVTFSGFILLGVFEGATLFKDELRLLKLRGLKNKIYNPYSTLIIIQTLTLIPFLIIVSILSILSINVLRMLSFKLPYSTNNIIINTVIILLILFATSISTFRMRMYGNISI